MLKQSNWKFKYPCGNVHPAATISAFLFVYHAEEEEMYVMIIECTELSDMSYVVVVKYKVR